MIIDLIGFDRRNTKKLEAYLREYKSASNFSDALYCNYHTCSNDFIREFKEEFTKVCNHYWHFDNEARINFQRIRSYNFYKELFEKD